MAIEAVVFDWGGTLTVHRVTVDEVVDRWRAAAEVIAPDRADELADALFRADQGNWDDARRHHRAFTLDRVFERALADPRTVDLSPSSSQLEAAADAYLGAWEAVVAHDADARDVLEGLRDRGLRTGLLSNTFWPGHFHDRLLVRDELHDLLHARCYSCELPNLKPHPSAFGAVLAALGVDDPSHAVFVGDRADDDIAGAQAVGMRTVWRPDATDPFAPPPADTEPDAVISSLRELLALVDAWS